MPVNKQFCRMVRFNNIGRYKQDVFNLHGMVQFVHKYLTLDVFTVCEIDLTSSLAYFKLNAK